MRLGAHLATVITHYECVSSVDGDNLVFRTVGIVIAL